jgi:signal transduction histidine kinase
MNRLRAVTRRFVPSSLRGRLALAALLVTAAWVVLLTVAFNAILANRLAVQANSTLQTRASSVAALVTVDSAGQVSVRSPADGSRLDPGVWVYTGTKTLRRPSGDDRLQHSADRLAQSAGGFAPADDDPLTKLYALPVRINGKRVATVVAAIDLDAFLDARHVTLVGSAAVALVLLTLVYLTSREVVARALRPVEQMARQAADWSTSDLDHRFGSHGRPAELERLAVILDELLARQAAVVRSDQQLTAELSHELRTPLTVMSAELDLLRSRPRTPEELDAAHASIAAGVTRMSGLLETLLAEARGRARSVPGRCALASALHAVVEQAPAAGPPLVQVRPEPDPRLTAGVDTDVLERILSPLLDNARRYAGSTVTLTAAQTADTVTVTVTDDGPGVPPELAERIFEPGFSAAADGPSPSHGGAGLGLPLARRIARGIGGEVSLDPAGGPGAVFVLTLPPG